MRKVAPPEWHRLSGADEIDLYCKIDSLGENFAKIPDLKLINPTDRGVAFQHPDINAGNTGETFDGIVEKGAVIFAQIGVTSSVLQKSKRVQHGIKTAQAVMPALLEVAHGQCSEIVGRDPVWRLNILTPA